MLFMTIDGVIGAGIFFEDSYSPDMGLLFGVDGRTIVTNKVITVSGTCHQKYP